MEDERDVIVVIDQNSNHVPYCKIVKYCISVFIQTEMYISNCVTIVYESCYFPS